MTSHDGNDIAQSDIAKDLMSNYIKAFWNKLRNGYGEIEEIHSSLGDKWIDVAVLIMAQILKLNYGLRVRGAGNKAHPVFKQLLPGDRIYYSGKIIREMSITESGMMSNPEIKIDPVDITKIE